MTDDLLQALLDAVDRRATEDTTSLEQARQERIRASRETYSRYDFRDPALTVPGRIDNQRKREGNANRTRP